MADRERSHSRPLALTIMKAFTATLIFVLSATHAGRLHAEELTTAEQSFREGREAMLSEDYVRAERAFEASLRAEISAAALLNLAVSEERLGHLLSARSHLEQMLGLLDAKDERHGVGLRLMDALDKRIPTLEVRAPASFPRERRTVLDSRTLASAELERRLLVDPGPHVLQVFSVGGVLLEERRVMVSEQDTLVVSLLPEPVHRPVSLPPNPVHRSPQLARQQSDASEVVSSRPLASYLLAGVGVGAIGLTVGTGIAAVDKKDEALAECPGKRCTERGLLAAEDARKFAAISTISLAAAVTSLGVASWLFFTHQPRPASRSLAFDVSSSRDQSRVLVSGAF